MYIIPDDVIYDPLLLAAFLAEHRITRVLFTPSLLQALLEFKGLELDKAFQFMRCVYMTGKCQFHSCMSSNGISHITLSVNIK